MANKALQLAALCLCAFAGTSGNAVTFTKADEEALAWLDTIGLPDIKGAPYVRAVTSLTSKHGDEPAQHQFVDGFLLKDDGREFRIFVPEARSGSYPAIESRDSQCPLILSFVKSPPGPSEEEPVSYEMRDLAHDATELVESVRKPVDPSALSDMGRGVSTPARALVFAWCCRQNGLDQIAQELVQHFSGTLRNFSENNKSLREYLENELSTSYLWQATLDFGNTKIPRKQLLATFASLEKRFPNSRHQERIREANEILQQMVAEDSAHQQKDSSSLSADERTAELIFQLRDQHGEQVSEPGACDIFFLDAYKPSNSPASQLVKIGYEAVPQLIAALRDERFTRAVECHRGFYFSHHVLRVRDCALLVLERIADRSFHQPRPASGEWKKGDEIAETVQSAQTWWNEFQKKGEKQFLIEAVRSGDNNSPSQAEKLLKKYPDAALAAIQEGTQSAKDWTRERLVDVAAKIDADSAVEFLRGEMKAGACLQSRLAAARALFQHGHDEAISAMVTEWQKDLPTLREDKSAEYIQALNTIGFLARSGKIEAVEGLKKNLDKQPVDLRMAVVRAFAHDARATESSSSAPETRSDPKFERAVEDFLVSMLDDSEARYGQSGSWDEAHYADPRICDMAAFFLSRRWPQKYSFNWSTISTECDPQIIKLKNSWRTERGLADLPSPSTETVVAANGPAITAELQKLERASSNSEQIRAASAIENKFGLSALPVVRARLADRETTQQALAPIQQLAGRLANRVREIRVAPAPGDDKVKARLDQLRLAPITVESLQDILIFLIANLPPGKNGFSFTAERTNDAGFLIAVNWFEGPIHANEHNWLCAETVVVGDKPAYSVSGSRDYNSGPESDPYTDLRKALARAFLGDVSDSLAVHFRAVAEPPIDMAATEMRN